MVAFRSLICCATFLFSIAARSAELSLPLTDDATVTGNRASANYGAITTIVVHDFGPKQGVVKFDGGSIGGETVQSATLSMYLNAITGSGTVTVHPITSTWDEGSVTWSTLPSYETAAVSSASLSSSNVGSFVTLDVTDTVQRWANGSLEANGFLIQTTAAVRATFQSKENSGGNPPMLDVVVDDAPPPPTSATGTPPIVLDLSYGPIVIDEPGHYVLDRDWEMTDNGYNRVLIDVLVNATIDMRGFEIDESSSTVGTVLRFNDAGGTVMNGRIVAGFDGSPLNAIGKTVVERMQLYTFGDDALGISISGRNSKISESTIGSSVYLHGDYISIESSYLSGYEGVLYVWSNHSTISGNRLDAFACCEFGVISGDNNVFANNKIEHGENAPDGLLITGNENLILGNTFKLINEFSEPLSHMEVSGSGNIIKDNVSVPGRAPTIGIGIEFSSDGNFYQNNAMNALVPFELNGTTQTDLGGNVGY